MNETKETLATRLANRSNGSKSSPYNPFTRDGVKVVTLAQELGGLGVLSEGGQQGRPWAWVWYHKDVGKALDAIIYNADPRNTTSGKVLWGSTAVGLITNFFKRRGKQVKAGLIKVN